MPSVFEWPFSEGPETFVVVWEDSVRYHSFDDTQVLDIPSVRAGTLLDGRLVFALSDNYGTWTWPPDWGIEMNVPGGSEAVGLVVAQAGMETSTWFHDAVIMGDRAVVLYREIFTESEPQAERLMFRTIDPPILTQHVFVVEVFEKTTRRPGLFDEEKDAFFVDAAIGTDRIVVVFGVGDGTWLEWYELNGQPVDGPALDTYGTIIDVAIAGNEMVIGLETELHQGVKEALVLNLETGEPEGPYPLGSDDGLISDLQFDGEWITASVWDVGGIPVGVYMSRRGGGISATILGPRAILLSRN